MEGLNTCIIMSYLGIISCFDIKYKKMPLWILGCGEMLGIIYWLINWQNFKITVFLSLLPGIFLVVFSFISEQQIGYGDGLCMLVIGTLMNIKECILVLCFGFLGISLLSIILLVTKKANRKTKIPFIPFLFLGESIYLLINCS